MVAMAPSRNSGGGSGGLGLAAGTAGAGFEEGINDTFYHARQFGIRDLNAYVLYFIRPSGSA